jgi:hypothetical protein
MIDAVTERERIADGATNREQLPELLAGLGAIAPKVLHELQMSADAATSGRGLQPAGPDSR